MQKRIKELRTYTLSEESIKGVEGLAIDRGVSRSKIVDDLIQKGLGQAETESDDLMLKLQPLVESMIKIIAGGK